MNKALAIGAALALLLQIVENFLPVSQGILPLGKSGFVQTSGLMLGAVALYALFQIFHDGDDGDDGDDGSTIL